MLNFKNARSYIYSCKNYLLTQLFLFNSFCWLGLEVCLLVVFLLSVQCLSVRISKRTCDLYVPTFFTASTSVLATFRLMCWFFSAFYFSLYFLYIFPNHFWWFCRPKRVHAHVTYSNASKCSCRINRTPSRLLCDEWLQ